MSSLLRCLQMACEKISLTFGSLLMFEDFCTEVEGNVSSEWISDVTSPDGHTGFVSRFTKDESSNCCGTSSNGKNIEPSTYLRFSSQQIRMDHRV
ncbi:hypothetical protein TNIN_284931 [Trichonephila inaurata madagascariensis]|uniref:Uncharacterized protein n=1 Tax=Trichonephila inaurata madagascariensis TaxID=2747483 RepID=A0A8X7BQ82_9ARAC|nr:hypothetical protein TNIN_284931 [Trichonephila inaurata madagascariensis]